jgi:hypothetical protein
MLEYPLLEAQLAGAQSVEVLLGEGRWVADQWAEARSAEVLLVEGPLGEAQSAVDRWVADQWAGARSAEGW